MKFMVQVVDEFSSSRLTSSTSYSHPGKEMHLGYFLSRGGLMDIRGIGTRVQLELHHIITCLWSRRGIIRMCTRIKDTYEWSAESVDEGLSFSWGMLSSNTMVSVLAKQKPLDLMISATSQEQTELVDVYITDIAEQKWLLSHTEKENLKTNIAKQTQYTCAHKHTQTCLLLWLTRYFDWTLKAGLDLVNIIIP